MSQFKVVLGKVKLAHLMRWQYVHDSSGALWSIINQRRLCLSTGVSHS